MRTRNIPQVDKRHYTFDYYSSERRYVNYYHQVKNVMYFVEHHNARKILIAGKGDGIVQRILETYSGLFELDLYLRTFDFAEDLQPDILGDLVNFEELVNQEFDVILCCQTLEHLPFGEALSVLSQFNSKSTYVVISVPNKAPAFRVSVKVPVFDEAEFLIKMPLWKKKEGMVDSRHYWEIGYSINVRSFRKKLNEIGFTILSDYVVKKDGYKHFFILSTNE